MQLSATAPALDAGQMWWMRSVTIGGYEGEALARMLRRSGCEVSTRAMQALCSRALPMRGNHKVEAIDLIALRPAQFEYASPTSAEELFAGNRLTAWAQKWERWLDGRKLGRVSFAAGPHFMLQYRKEEDRVQEPHVFAMEPIPVGDRGGISFAIEPGHFGKNCLTHRMPGKDLIEPNDLVVFELLPRDERYHCV